MRVAEGKRKGMSDRAKKPTDPTKRQTSGSQTRERNERVILFANAAEKAEIETRAEKAGLSVSGYLRALAFGKDTPQPKAARRPPTNAAALGALRYELRKIGGNLNQIAHHLNQGKDFDSRAFAAIYAEQAAVLKAIMEALGRGEA